MLETKKEFNKKTILKSTILLSLAGFISKFLGAFYRIPLSNIIGAEGMGLYQLIYPLYSFALVFVSGGIPFSLSRLISASLGKNKSDRISKYFFVGFVYSFLIGVFFALVFSVFAKQIASLQGSIDAYIGYYAIGVSTFFACLVSSFRGVFQGYSNMVPTFVSQIIEQGVKLFFGLLLSIVLLPYGIVWAVFGTLIAVALAEFFAFVYYLIVTFFHSKKGKIHINFSKQKLLPNKQNFKEVFFLAVPTTLSSLLAQLALAFQSLFIIKILINAGLSEGLAKQFFGIQNGMINAIINFPTIISVSIAIAIVPSISFYLEIKDKESIAILIKNVFKSTWLLILPCAAGLFVLSKSILTFTFSEAITSDMLTASTLLMQISAFSILFIALTQITTVLLQVSGKTWRAFLGLSILLLSNILLVLTLPKAFSIYGLAVANLISYALVCLVNLFFLEESFLPKMSIKEILVPLVASVVIAFGINVLLQHFKYLPNLILVCGAVIIFMVIYFVIIFLFKIFKVKDILKIIKK